MDRKITQAERLELLGLGTLLQAAVDGPYVEGVVPLGEQEPEAER